MPWSGVEVTDVEHVGGTDLGRARGRQRECGHDDRHESVRRQAGPLKVLCLVLVISDNA
jgi:hypothetical protein